jgi:nucleoside-diphosphate-sugar epimerase
MRVEKTASRRGIFVTTLIIGCGYLGERLGTRLGRAGEPVYGTVRSQARAAGIAAQGVQPLIADVLDPASLRGLPTADRLFYCVGFDRSVGASMRAVYVDGLVNLLESLPTAVTRLVYASSTGVYGQTDGEWIDEETPPHPRTESGKVCLEAEERLRAWTEARQGAIDSVILRFAGLYGPGRVVRRALVERGEPIPGDPSKLFNLIQIEDAARVAVAALSARAPDPLYLVSDDRPVTRLEYYSLLATLLNAPAPTFAPPQPGGPEESRDSTSKRVANHRIKTLLGAALTYPDITTGLPAAIRS